MFSLPIGSVKGADKIHLGRVEHLSVLRLEPLRGLWGEGAMPRQLSAKFKMHLGFRTPKMSGSNCSGG
jgi:hypothetical protein